MDQEKYDYLKSQLGYATRFGMWLVPSYNESVEDMIKKKCDYRENDIRDIEIIDVNEELSSDSDSSDSESSDPDSEIDKDSTNPNPQTVIEVGNCNRKGEGLDSEYDPQYWTTEECMKLASWYMKSDIWILSNEESELQIMKAFHKVVTTADLVSSDENKLITLIRIGDREYEVGERMAREYREFMEDDDRINERVVKKGKRVKLGLLREA